MEEILLLRQIVAIHSQILP